MGQYELLDAARPRRDDAGPGTTEDHPMTADRPPGTSTTISPHLVVRDAARAAVWYSEALGAVERRRIPVPGGRLMSVELAFGATVVELADEFPELGVRSPLAIGGTAVVLHLATNDVDALWRRAIAAGATVVHPLADQFWGERQGQVDDPFGHRWNLAQRIR